MKQNAWFTRKKLQSMTWESTSYHVAEKNRLRQHDLTCNQQTNKDTKNDNNTKNEGRHPRTQHDENKKTPNCDGAWCCVLAVDTVPINTTAVSTPP